jgi:hypothetical protein
MPSNLDQNPQGNNPMNVQGSSEIYKFGMSPDSRAVLSQKVRLLTPTYRGVPGQRYQLGVVSEFSPSGGERSTEIIRGIGFGDIIADRVPGVTGEYTASIARTLMYVSNLFQSLGFAGGVDGPVRSVMHTRWPFDMEEQMVFTFIADDLASDSTASGLVEIDFQSQNVSTVQTRQVGNTEVAYQQKHKALITFYEGCWLHSIDMPARSADGGIMSESASVGITDVHDLFTTYGEFLATGGGGNSVRTRTASTSTRATTGVTNQVFNVPQVNVVPL